MEENYRNKALMKRHTIKSKNFNYSYSILPTSYYKVYNYKIVKSSNKKNKKTEIKTFNLLGNNYTIKTNLNKKNNNDKKANNKTINNRKEIIYNNIYFSLNNSSTQNTIKVKYEKPKYNETKEFSTIQLKEKNYKHETSKKINNRKENIKLNKFNDNIEYLRENKINLNKKKQNNINNSKNKNNININKKPISTDYLKSSKIINNSIKTKYKESSSNNINNKNYVIQKDTNYDKNQDNIYYIIKKNSQLRSEKAKIGIFDNRKTPTNYYYHLTDVSPNVPKINNENNMKKFSYIQNKKNIINSIELEKERLINESYQNYKKYLYLMKKQQKELKEYDNFLKKELNDNQDKQLKLKLFNSNLQKDGAKSYFTLVKSKNLRKSLTNDIINENQLNNNLVKYNKNTASINKSLQKYFSLNSNDERKISKEKNNNIKTVTNNNDFDKNYNKITKLNKSSNLKEFKINMKTLKKLRKLNVRNIQNKYNKITFKTEDECRTLKNINEMKSPNYFENKDNNNIIVNESNEKEIKKRLIIKNKNIYKNYMKEKEFKLKSESYYNRPSSLFFNNKNNSLPKLKKLDDYIGINQYGSVIIPPNNKKKIYRMISEEKERTLNKLKNLFKFEENKRNNDYYSQTKNRETKNFDDYFNKKDLDKIVLSSDKKSKYNKIKNEIYYEAFKSCKYK